MEEYSKNKGLNDKIKYSINLLQKAEKMALSMNENELLEIQHELQAQQKRLNYILSSKRRIRGGSGNLNNTYK